MRRLYVFPFPARTKESMEKKAFKGGFQGNPRASLKYFRVKRQAKLNLLCHLTCVTSVIRMYTYFRHVRVALNAYHLLLNRVFHDQEGN